MEEHKHEHGVNPNNPYVGREFYDIKIKRGPRRRVPVVEKPPLSARNVEIKDRAEWQWSDDKYGRAPSACPDVLVPVIGYCRKRPDPNSYGVDPITGERRRVKRNFRMTEERKDKAAQKAREAIEKAQRYEDLWQQQANRQTPGEPEMKRQEFREDPPGYRPGDSVDGAELNEPGGANPPLRMDPKGDTQRVRRKPDEADDSGMHSGKRQRI